jgi:hypothetical protein
VTVEDRLRATTEAVTAAMRPVRPLDITPDAAGAKAPAKRRLARPPRRWGGWLSPLAAAVAVIAVAATVVAVRNLSDGGLGSGSASAAPASAAAPSGGVPRYYVADTVTSTSKTLGPEDGVFVGDARTGKRLVTFNAPSGGSYGLVAGSADDRTFVVEAGERSAAEPPSWRLSWYVLRLTPGGAPQARLTRIPVAASVTSGMVLGMVLSPDGREFAVASRAASGTSTVVTSADRVTLRTYSVATGQVLRTWTSPVSQQVYAFGDLSWLDDGHTLAFAYPAGTSVRTLDTSSPGTSLTADSKAVFSVPGGHACNDVLLITGDGKSVICGIMAPNNGWCTTGQLNLSAYSVATGKLDRVLYRYQGRCTFGFTIAVWARSAALAVGVIAVSTPTTSPDSGPFTVRVGIVTPGTFTSLPVTLTQPSEYEAVGELAF